MDLIALTQVFNKFRMEHQSRTYTRQELLDELYKIGMNKSIAPMFIAKFVPSEKIGKSKLYSMSSEPIHKSQISSLYENYNENNRKKIEKKKEESRTLSAEESAIELLQSQGYQVRRIVGFNLERFKAENPVLYKKYLKYEIV